MKLQAPSLTSYHQILNISRSPSFSHSSTHRSPPPPSSRFLLQRLQCCYHHHQPQQSRRNLLIAGSSSTLPLLISTYFETTKDAQAAAEVEESRDIVTSNEKNCENQTTVGKVYFDVSIDREPIGRIIVGLYGENSTTTTVGAARFAKLVSGTAGVSYRRKDFVKIMPNYIQHGGIRSIGVDTELAKRGSQADLIADELLSEWEMNNNDKNKNCLGSNSTRNVAGSVGIIVRNPSKPAPKLKLVAKKGKLVIDEEEIGVDPNGTEFVIATKDSPELDASTLVIGRVLQGMDVVEMISKVQTVQENTTSPYFK